MRETINMLRSRLTPVYGRGEANAMIGLIFHHLKGWNATDMIINEDKPLSPYIRSEIEKILTHLEAGEPIQYVVGEAWFYGLLFKVDRRVLIPRPETAELVDMIVDRYADCKDLNVLDLGTGSGCIAIALARNLKFAHVTGIDVSPGALAVARANAESLSVDVKLEEADMLSYVPDVDEWDIIVSNPPYVTEREKGEMDKNVLDWEPETALFVPDSDPLKYYKGIAEVARRGLKKGGRLYLEINPLFYDKLTDMLKACGFAEVESHLDIHGRRRFVTCMKKQG